MDSKDDIEIRKGEITIHHIEEIQSQYTDAEYRLLRRKVDRYLLPLMFLCHGLQSIDKSCISTQATFGLREDTGLVGQQFSWLTTVFYITYLLFEMPSMLLLQRYPMGRILSVYIILWGLAVLCIGFAKNFTHLVTLRAIQGLFECCISPGFILIVGTWYTTREHAARALVFQSGYVGIGTFFDLTAYGIGSVSDKNPGVESWRYMSFFLGGLTMLAGVLCLFFLGTPSEVRWLSSDEKKMATARILDNNTGHDTTGTKQWKWEQVRECLVDPTFWFAGLSSFLGSVPNGGLTAFGAVLNTSFGFTNLQAVLLNLPKYAVAILLFAFVGWATMKKNNLRMWFMSISNIPPLIGFLMISLLPNEPQYKWTKWGAIFMTIPFAVATFLGWSIIPSNVGGRTKRTAITAFTFLGYCAGNMTGSQIFEAKDAPRYIPATIACAGCLGLQIFVILTWRTVLAMRNKRGDERMRELGLSEEDRVRLGKELGEKDCTDLENPFFRYTM
ncbi:MFS general substrate transporter [Hypoxylon rubiginosum]|uniref:MFS general substrate transporter n=1 Tax=Hypoxylon rubiginosum TaxID=110542 RepID=A0ACC0DGD5_9PEZI|nr:MFS general substrate transporter [Hypoxylon rubiginosum]